MAHATSNSNVTPIATIATSQDIRADVTINNVATGNDLAEIFGHEENASLMQLAVLSDDEMDDTEGAVAPIVVYGLVVGGRIVYVGITNNLTRRVVEHAATKSFQSVVKFAEVPTREAARLLEQSAMSYYGTLANGWNKINSIATSNQQPALPACRQMALLTDVVQI
ncbi:MAG: hypothetical protein Q8O37_16660 [Sulfuricellaceae bacterium]|nr:hypothetical protein [Sulfuricellaceae bacterium]